MDCPQKKNQYFVLESPRRNIPKISAFLNQRVLWKIHVYVLERPQKFFFKDSYLYPGQSLKIQVNGLKSPRRSMLTKSKFITCRVLEKIYLKVIKFNLFIIKKYTRRVLEKYPRLWQDCPWREISLKHILRIHV